MTSTPVHISRTNTVFLLQGSHLLVKYSLLVTMLCAVIFHFEYYCIIYEGHYLTACVITVSSLIFTAILSYHC